MAPVRLPLFTSTVVGTMKRARFALFRSATVTVGLPGTPTVFTIKVIGDSALDNKSQEPDFFPHQDLSFGELVPQTDPYLGQRFKGIALRLATDGYSGGLILMGG